MGEFDSEGAQVFSIPHVLIVPYLNPDGIEVKLFHQGAAPLDSRVELSVENFTAGRPWGERLWLGLEGAPRWSPENPQLLTLTINCEDIQRDVRFGLRRVETCGKKLFLNGEPLYVRGFGCDGDPRGRLCNQVTTIDGYKRYVQRAKEFGFNLMRSHGEDNDRPEAFMDVCDEEGLMFWPEFRFDPAQGIEALAHFWNHPSVIWWCWGNEISQDELFPWAEQCYRFVKDLDPSRLILDNSGLGACDRTTTDLLSHHLGYYFPHGRHANMYSSYGMLAAEESTSGLATTDLLQQMREGSFDPGKPLLAHETGNHQAFPDVKQRAVRMNLFRRDQLLSKVTSDRRENYLDTWITASTKFKLAMDKLWMEQARKSPILEGYEMWMLADHGNIFAGLIEDGDDCIVKPGVEPAQFRVHNAADVLLAEFPTNNSQRIFLPEEICNLDLLSSVYGKQSLTSGTVVWRLMQGAREVSRGEMAAATAPRGYVSRLCHLQIPMPHATTPLGLQLDIELQQGEGVLKRGVLKNIWNVWVFPDVGEPYPGEVIVTHGLTDDILERLEGGARVLLTLQEPAAFSIRREVFQSVLARFRPQIWEWGHNLGAAITDHPAMAGFPHDGFSDLQFFNVIDKGRKIILDRCPFPIDPIVHAVDLPMMTYSREIYSRIGTYLFELQVGRGRLLVSGFNFSSQAKRHVEVRTLLASLLRYAQSQEFEPTCGVTAEELRAYRQWMLLDLQPSPCPSAETGWDTFYQDRELNIRDRFAAQGEELPIVVI